MILLLIKPHTCPGRWIYLALFSVSAPLCQKIEPKSIMIVCLSLPTFPVLLGLTLSPASDGLGGSGLGGPPLAVPQSAWPVPLRLGAVCLFRSALALASSRSDAQARNSSGPGPGTGLEHLAQGSIRNMSIPVAVSRAGTACSLPETRTAGRRARSNPPAVVGSPAMVYNTTAFFEI